uniref:Uncharacterized protein n=1 Tax=Panagrolaimus sp. PS1159 TaxID=55785 RepID=A0AC35GDF2_9BILA
MTTNGEKLFLKIPSVSNDNNRYTNLNLNQNNKNSNIVYVQSDTKPICDSYVGDNYQRKDFKNKSTKNLQVLNNLKGLTLTSNQTSTNSWLKNKDKLNPANSSTLSLHIAAFENTVEPQKGVEESKSEKKPLTKNEKICIFLQKFPGIEFPRQQDSNEGVTPEIGQFRASQTLFNPNAFVPPQEQPQPQTKQWSLTSHGWEESGAALVENTHTVICFHEQKCSVTPTVEPA